MKLCALRLLSGIRFLAVFLTVALVISCADPNRSEYSPSGQIKVKIPVAENGSYVLKTVELDSLEDMRLLRGEAAHFYFSPGVANGQLTGFEPRVHLMRTADGTYVAQDPTSAGLLALYANFEGLMKMDAALGVKDLNTWPRPVAINTSVLDSEGRTSSDNARYSGKLDAFLFEPFKLDELPLMVNSGVIAHEHFHSLFYKIILKNLGGPFALASHADIHDSEQLAQDMHLAATEVDETLSAALNERDLYHLTLLRGMNEGLADVWGWIYSGDTDFVGRSLKMEKTRDLKQMADPLPPQAVLENDWARFATLNETMISQFNPYYLGSIYAKTMHQLVTVSLNGKAAITDATEPQLKLRLAQAILRSLPKLGAAITALKGDEKISPIKLLEILSDEIDFLNETNCQVLSEKVVNQENSKVCARFHKNAEPVAPPQEKPPKLEEKPQVETQAGGQ